MKNSIYTLIILILLAFTLVGCSQSSERVSTSENKQQTKQKDKNEQSDIDPNKIANAGDIAITVYKSPTCGCCTSWESHMAKSGFHVMSKSTDQMTKVREENKVPKSLQSCHTAIVDGYVIEGHVPASDVKKLLTMRPKDIVGLAAPGMPPDSPGMQPEGEKPSNYDVLSFDKQGKTKVFASY